MSDLDFASILSAKLMPDYQEQMLARQQADAQTQQADNQRQLIALKVAEEQRKAQAQAAFEAERDQVLLKPDPHSLAMLALKYPDQFKGAKDGFDMLDADRKTNDLTQMGAVYSRAKEGDYAGAAASLRTRIDADKAAGQDVTEDEHIATALESGDPIQQRAALGTIGMHIAAIAPKEFAETYGKLNGGGENASAFAKEYNDRVGLFGKAAADAWAEQQDTKLVPVQAGGKVFSYGGGTTGTAGYGDGTPSGGPSQPKGGDPASSGSGAIYGYNRVVPTNRQDWDKRADGSAKGMGFLGLLQRPDGGVSSEISAGVDAQELGLTKEHAAAKHLLNEDGYIDIPTMVPGLTKPELDYLMTHEPDLKKNPKFFAEMPPGIMRKAGDYARQRIAAGLSPFAQDGEGAATARPETPAYAMPVQGGTFTSHIGDARSGGRKHNGQDITAPAGSPVWPIFAGVVVGVGRDNLSGNFVKVKHPDGTTSSYAHLATQAVKVGDPVAPGHSLGTVGSTGNATGSVLHLRVVDKSGRNVDPRALLGGLRVKVRSIQEARRLPRGTKIFLPDGRQGTVP